MKNINKYIAIVSIGLFSVTCMAQEDEAPAAFIYSTYYYCDVATQDAMDEIVATTEAPVFDKWVEDGKLIGWGYYKHYTGGRWRRLQYHLSSSIEDALNAQNAIFSEIYADNTEAGQARSDACYGHDDYIWAADQGSGPSEAAPAASLSVYHVCKLTGQQRADEIFAEVYAPQLDELVKKGDITGWGWNQHRLGGKYRRLQTIFGADHASVVAANGQVIGYANENHSALAQEFSDICGSHTDYLWDIEH
jgi:hypothetical protein